MEKQAWIEYQEIIEEELGKNLVDPTKHPNELTIESND